MKYLVPLLAILFFFPSVSHAALATNLVSYWKLDEASGTAADSVGSNTLTNNNTVPFGSGKINNGASTTPTGSKYFSITDASQSGLDITGDITMAGWVRFVARPTGFNYMVFMGKFDASGTWAYGMLLEDVAGDGSSQSLNMMTSSTGSNQDQGKVTVGTINNGTYYHFAATKSGSTYTAYLNGVSIGTDTVYATVPNTTAKFELGAWNGAGNISNAQLDEWGIWSRALTGTEITTLYNAGAGCAYPFTTCEGGPPAITSDIILFE